MGLLFKISVFGFILLACDIHCTTACLEASSPVHGNMTKDFDLLVGLPLTVQCTLFSNDAVINGTHYHVTSENLVIKFGKLAVEDLVILDPFSVGYTVENSTVNDTGIYTCYLSLPELENMIFVCTTYVAVGYPPLPIEDFSCLSLHYKNLTCTWVKPFNPITTNYEIWDYFQYVALKRRCPTMINATTCQWRLDSYPPYRKSAKILYFLLIGNNSLGINRQSIIIDHFKFVKPAPVQKLHFSNITKKSIVVNWSAPSGMEYNDFPPGLVYSIKYCPIFPLRKSCTEVESSGGLMHTIENLVPFTEYEFKVRCRSSVAIGEDMWSPTVGLSAKTLPDVPYLAPKVTFSSYEVKTILGNRSVTLYWKAIPSEYQNGKDLHYIIQYHIHHVRTKREDFEIQAGNVTSYTFKHMDLNTAYLFKIFAQNDVGPAPKSSLIVVDKNSKLLNPPKDLAVLSHGRGNYTVSWQASPEAQSYTLFWCQEIKPWPFKCEGPLQWMHTTKTKHELNLYDIDTNFQFAVSANDGEQTSGMKWATCFVPYSGVLYKVKSVNLTPKNATSIQVQWTLDCDAQRTVIKEYAISYCVVDGMCTGDIRNISCREAVTRVTVHQTSANVSSDASPLEYVIGSLIPYTCYRVLVRARTGDGWSEDSDVMYESTLPSAPSDSPRGVSIVDVNGTTIHIHFQKPLHPNGKITRYVVYYSRTKYSTEYKHHFEITAAEHSDDYYVEISNGIYYYTNYSIGVTACVDKACSPMSDPVYVLTGIGSPGLMDAPHIQTVNSSYVNITWNPPNLPNGPNQEYQVTIRWKENSKDEGVENEVKELYNVTDITYLAINLDCPLEIQDETMYFISVRAVNEIGKVPLFGPRSKETQSTLCFAVTEGLSYGMVVGIAAGCAIGLVMLVSIVYGLLSWMKTEVDLIKGINVQLPKGLDLPSENPLSNKGYKNFKKGLRTKKKGGVSPEEGLKDRDQLCSHASEVDVKDAVEGDAPSDGFLTKEKRDLTGRNHSGESNDSDKGHDSISSTNTTKTHLSIDSGAEVDSPPSPDGFSSETSSTNTTPRSYKPDLAIVIEGEGCNSKDSGLEKEDPFSMPHRRNIDLPSKFDYFVKQKNQPYFNVMPPYSKVAVCTPSNLPTYVRVGEQNVGLLDNHSLSNSEPSVADFEIGSDSEPLVMGISPYSKFGLARSAGNGLNQAFTNSQNLGYAKFGTVYRALKCNDTVNDKLVAKELKPCPTHPNAMPILFTRNMLVKDSKTLGNSSTDMRNKSPKVDKNCSMIEEPHSTPKKEESRKGYVSFNDALKKPAVETFQASSTQPSNMAYSKFSVTTEIPPRSDSTSSVVSDSAICNNIAYSNLGFTPETSQENGYISFQDAKVKFVECRPEREFNGHSQPCTINLEDISSKEAKDEASVFPVAGIKCLDIEHNEAIDNAMAADFSAIEPLGAVSIDLETLTESNSTPNSAETAMQNGFFLDVDKPIIDFNCSHPFGDYFLNGDSDEEPVEEEIQIRPTHRTNSPCKLYVPLNKLTSESNATSRMIAQPNVPMSMNVEHV